MSAASKVSHPTSRGASTRLNRRNKAKQALIIKRSSLLSATRIFNGVDGVPRTVAVIPLTEDVHARMAVEALAESLNLSVEADQAQGIHKLKVEHFKTSLQFITVPHKLFYAALDACKVADYVLFILSSVVEVDSWGDTLLRTLQAQGLPSVITVLAKNPDLDPKSRSKIQKSLLSFIQYFVPNQTKVLDLYSNSDRIRAIRALSEGRPTIVRSREGRTWILAENFTYADDGKLEVTGIIRGAPLSVNRLFHLPNFGDFKISKITSATARSEGSDMDVEPRVLAERHDSNTELPITYNNFEDLTCEQTWLTEEETKDAKDVSRTEPEIVIPDAKEGTTPRRLRRIPKGMSDYQATWIVSEDEEDDDDELHKESSASETQEQDGVTPQSRLEDEEIEAEISHNDAFKDLDMEEEDRQLEHWRNREREEKDDLSFPDEVDTPKDVPARIRFQRYRGLQSLRTSPWDPYENLPAEYARIFEFEDYKLTERSVFYRAEKEESMVATGVRVTVYLQGVPTDFRVLHNGSLPVILLGLLEHENKMTVLNMTIQRNTECGGSVRSKDPLILCIGPRRLKVNPIFSKQTRGGKGANNVHKFERYLRHNVANVATVYGPVVFGKQPCVLLRETPDPQGPQLVAMGAFLNSDITRIIAKRIILTGHPFKVHRKTSTVRFMFFNPEDVQYFKPVAIHTKHGRAGHIVQSLGTHGYFKAHFDGPINQMDTVCMSLYKRVFPRWGQLWQQEADHSTLTSQAMEE